VGKANTVIVIFDVASAEFTVVDKFEAGFIPAQVCLVLLIIFYLLPNFEKNKILFKACWYKNDALVYCAYNDQPYKLGLVYCPIRK
jgi:hypothetical protein